MLGFEFDILFDRSAFDNERGCVLSVILVLHLGGGLTGSRRPECARFMSEHNILPSTGDPTIIKLPRNPRQGTGYIFERRV